MVISTFGWWALAGLVTALFVIIGYLINRYILEKNKDKNPEPPILELMMQKIDQLTSAFGDMAKDVSDVKTYIGIQTEKNTNVHEKISEINKRLDNHGTRIATIEKVCSGNHGKPIKDD